MDATFPRPLVKTLDAPGYRTATSDVRLLIDFGSTFTKVVAVDLEKEEIVARSQAPSTVQEDVTVGLKDALRDIGARVDVDKLEKQQLLACSSAAGGLRMVCVGFVPDYTSKAATQAALGAGAKVVGCYSYQLTQGEVSEIRQVSPDILLLAGGTDGGDEKVIVHNARLLSRAHLTSHVIVAGNKSAWDTVQAAFTDAGKEVTFVQNVMPDVRTLDVEPCNRRIRDLFIKNIVGAKGVGKARTMVGDIIMPTPSAVLNAAELLAEGIDGEGGMGELIVADVGGATTDIDSVASGVPASGNITVAGLPEPYVKRTVEGDLGVRYSIDVLVEQLTARGYSISERLMQAARRLSRIDRLPQDEDEVACDQLLGHISIAIAMERHAGRVETVCGPHGQAYLQRGKDLTGVECVIGTGGPVVFSRAPRKMLDGVLFQETSPYVLKPKRPRFHVDERYMLYAAGLLAHRHPKVALHMMKKYLKQI